MLETPEEVEQRVTPLELFFDLVFVFAITQVTRINGRNASTGKAGRRRQRPEAGTLAFWGSARAFLPRISAGLALAFV